MKFTNYETVGNLESKYSLGCIELNQLKRQYTPADLFPAATACLKEHKYKESVRLYAAAGTYGNFDKRRVSDKSAHQAISALIITTFTPTAKPLKETLEPYFSILEQQNSEEMSYICKNIEAAGSPSYYPSYMIQHGLNTFNPNAKNPMVNGFDADKNWQSTLQEYLHCSHQ